MFGPEEEEFFQGVGKASSRQWVEHRGSFAKALPISALSQKLANKTILLTFTPPPHPFTKRNNNLWKVTSKFSLVFHCAQIATLKLQVVRVLVLHFKRTVLLCKAFDQCKASEGSIACARQVCFSPVPNSYRLGSYFSLLQKRRSCCRVCVCVCVCVYVCV